MAFEHPELSEARLAQISDQPVYDFRLSITNMSDRNLRAVMCWIDAQNRRTREQHAELLGLPETNRPLHAILLDDILIRPTNSATLYHKGYRHLSDWARGMLDSVEVPSHIVSAEAARAYEGWWLTKAAMHLSNYERGMNLVQHLTTLAANFANRRLPVPQPLIADLELVQAQSHQSFNAFLWMAGEKDRYRRVAQQGGMQQRPAAPNAQAQAPPGVLPGDRIPRGDVQMPYTRPTPAGPVDSHETRHPDEPVADRPHQEGSTLGQKEQVEDSNRPKDTLAAQKDDEPAASSAAQVGHQ